MEYRSGDIIYAEAAADQKAIDNAREFIKMRGYTSEQVKIIQRKEKELTMIKWK